MMKLRKELGVPAVGIE